ncbi:MAG: hypothetical protein KAS87_04465 [Candidatus Omnitrophica bacterium]|nr:hypothetical protein [Candidatus Omnitrophota bacterium]
MEEKERGMDEKEKKEKVIGEKKEELGVRREELGDREKELGGREEKEGSEMADKGGAEKQGEEIPKKKKKWVKPVITRVKLNPEMAVMGVCSTSAGSMEDSDPTGWCNNGSECRQSGIDQNADSAASS